MKTQMSNTVLGLQHYSPFVTQINFKLRKVLN